MIMYGGGGDGSINHVLDGGVVLKKGPWTAAEDEILAAYVRENGEGNWNNVQKNTGLARCGKSCRLRWANHLRSNLKKGSFNGDEERLIIQLHAQLGNKWARMAAQLPGRTDNEIKNFWNTRVKRLSRQGLPLYPPDIIPNHQLHPHPQHQQHQQHQHQHQHDNHHHQHQQQQQQMYYQAQSSQSNTPSSSPLPSPTSLNANANATATLNTFPSFNFRTTTASTANFLHPLSPHTPTTPQTPSTTPFSSPLTSPLHLFSLPRSQINANFTFPRPPPLLQPPSSLLAKRYHSAITPLNCINSVSTAPFSPVSRDSYTSFLTLPYSSPTASTATYYNTNYSLNPSPSSYPQETSSPSFLSSSPSLLSNPVYSQELHSNQIPQINPFGSCSLLEDVLQEAEALAGGDRPTKRRQITPSPPHYNNNDNFFSVSFGQYNTSDNFCPDKTKEEECLQVNTMQEDIAKLLDWGSDSGEISNGQSSANTDDNLVLDVLQFTSLYPDASNAVANDEHNNNCSWDDLYEIS